jgi:hypothetical protein
VIDLFLLKCQINEKQQVLDKGDDVNLNYNQTSNDFESQKFEIKSFLYQKVWDLPIFEGSKKKISKSSNQSSKRKEKKTKT